MKTLVVYDSAYGNTAKVAGAMCESLKEFGATRSLLVSEVKPNDLDQLDVLFVGSPTQGGRATESIMGFIDELSDNVVNNTKLAVFDTRLEASEQKKALKLLMRVIGYAAPKMAVALRRKSCDVLSDPQGFIVHDKEGPLRKGELEEAKAWAREIGQAFHAVK